MATHCQDLHVLGDTVLPCKAKYVWEVKCEVNNAAAGRSQVGLVEEDAQEEALHDGSHGEGQQKEKEDDSIAVVQHSSSLKAIDKKHTCIYVYFMIITIYIG